MKSKGILFLAMIAILSMTLITGAYALPGPIVTLVSPTNGAHLNYGNVNVKCTIQSNDLVQYLKSVTLYDDFTGTWQADGTQSISGQGPVTVTFSKSVSDGSYRWNCYACDTMNVCSFAPADYTFTVDTTVPDSDVNYFTHIDRTSEQISCEEGHIWLPYTSSIVVHGDSEDINGVSRADYGWDIITLPWENIQNTEDETNWGDQLVNWYSPQGFVSYPLTPGHHRVCARARDTFGNQENYGINDVWDVPDDDCCDVCIDIGYPPITTKTIGSPKYWSENMSMWIVNEKTTFTLTATDPCDGIPGSGVKYTKYRIQSPDGTWSEWQTYTEPFTLGTVDGIYHIEYYSADNAGNVEETQSETDKLDNIDPVTTKTVGDPKYPYAEGDWYVTSETTFTLSCADEEAGCDYTKYRINGGELQTYTDPFTLEGLDGVYTIEYYSVDNVENEESVQTEIDYLDNTAPNITILEPNQMEDEFGCEANIFTVKTSIFDLGSGLAGATAEIDYENGTSTGRTVTLTLQQGYWKGNLNHWDLTAGDYSIKVTAWDNLDNTGNEYAPIVLTYDVYFGGCTTFTVQKGQSGSTTFDVNLCHGGNATGLLMTKLCGVIDLSPTITVTGNPSYNVYQESYYDFIEHIFNWPTWGDNFLPLGGTKSTVKLTVNVPDEFTCNGNDIRCKVMGYKWGVADEGMNQPKTPSSTLGGIGWFDITCGKSSMLYQTILSLLV
jgi:hypothetical protein